MPTLLCVPILVHDVPSALEHAERARAGGADLVELRIDEFFSGSAGKAGEEETRSVLSLVARCPLPCIVTCRLTDEAGPVGGYDGPEPARIALFERLGSAEPSSVPPEHPTLYIDVEYAAYSRSANLKQKVNLAVAHPAQVREVSTRLILSTHDFTGRPSDLTRRVVAMSDEPAAAVVKVAYRARSVRDNLELLDLAADSARPMIALATGEFGLMSRVLAPKFAGFLTFASLTDQSATAPGQPTLEDMRSLYRVHAITPRTLVFGVIGWPVTHSKSPAFHNRAFEASGLDAVYLPLPVPPEYEHFKATVLELMHHPRLGFAGASVTIPHKENLVRLARDEGWSLDAIAAAAGAANTLTVRRNIATGAIDASVSNTDAPAAVEALGLDADALRSGPAIAILGAGGVARALAAGLVQAGARVLIANRTPERARALVADLAATLDAEPGRLAAVDVETLANHAPLLALVNATPIGMSTGPAPDAMPITDAVLTATRPAVVMDCVYTPERTPLIASATALGLRTVSGAEMFRLQATRQSSLWHERG